MNVGQFLILFLPVLVHHAVEALDFEEDLSMSSVLGVGVGVE